jgi:hypothetical protein
MSWIMPEPSLDEDDRFQVAWMHYKDPADKSVYVAILGPSGIGCIYCGGEPNGWIEVPAFTPTGRTSRTACCAEHKAFCIGWYAAKIDASSGRVVR